MNTQAVSERVFALFQLAFVLGWLLTPDKVLGFGLLVLGCMPGGGLAPLWCGIVVGDTSLSLCFTMLTNALALGKEQEFFLPTNEKDKDQTESEITIQALQGQFAMHSILSKVCVEVKRL